MYFVFSHLLYASFILFLITTTTSLLALALFLAHICNILSSLWERIDRIVTIEDTKSANINQIKQ